MPLGDAHCSVNKINMFINNQGDLLAQHDLVAYD